MKRTFKVKLPDLKEYSVDATYEVFFDGAYFSCQLSIDEATPVSGISMPEENELQEIQECISQLILDECETLQSFKETRYDC